MRTLARSLAPAISFVAALALVLPVAVVSPAQAASKPVKRIVHTSWGDASAFASGIRRGVTVTPAGVRIAAKPAGRRAYADPHGNPTRRYQFGRWASPWTEPGFALTELISSWSATTPRHTWVQVEMRGRTAGGTVGSWDTLARWSSGDGWFHRTSDGAQPDDLGRVATDTWRAHAGTRVTGYQLRVTLHRRAGTKKTPTLHTVGAMASRLPTRLAATSRPGPGTGIDLPVPRFSQMTHRGHFPKWGGGGQAWCSPTSVSMILAYHDALPHPREFAWVGKQDPSHSASNEPWVDHAARMTYDYGYRGTGNWPFNTAYAARYAGDAFVTRLRNLREAERFIAAGIPLVASISFSRGELRGAPISASNGHLLVIRGFTAAGNVITNDPAARRNAGVRRVYDRAELERAWQQKSGGLVYVVTTPAQSLPTRGKNRNW
ncbi:MAG: C39 family peptidase [Nocardioides sp.]|nr:C39 family peptidase [Nocardioides sp.]